MDGIFGALLEGFLPVTGGRGRRPDLTRWLGWPLAIVMFVLGLVGTYLVAHQLGKDMDAQGAVLSLLVPFGGTFLAGIAGARGAVRSLVAGTLSVMFAVFFGCCWALLLIFDALFLSW
jgi:hypothetical protein